MKSNLYNIETYGADYTVEHVIMQYERDDLMIPDFQRNYVWTLKQASKFIESCILGLPIPSFFFFKEDNNTKYLVVDGQQRIMTLVFFKKGNFKGGQPFRLVGVSKEFEGRTYQELSDDMRRRFDYAILRITIFKQSEPQGGMDSVYEVFSRLNTGGLKLTAHEVRNAVIRGAINDFMTGLNENVSWRNLYGKKTPDVHMKDEELILRFLSLYDEAHNYEPPMGEFLNQYMDSHKNAQEIWFAKKRALFEDTSKAVDDVLGHNAFRLKKTLNSAMSDSIMVAFARNIKSAIEPQKAKNIQKGYRKLVEDQQYLDAIETGTSQSKKVEQRIRLATKYLFGG